MRKVVPTGQVSPRLLLLVCLAFVLEACEPPKHRIAGASPGTLHFQVAEALSQLWETNLEYRWEIDTVGEGSVDNLTQLMRGEVDFALVQNDASLPEADVDPVVRLRTVPPLYDQVFFLIYKPELHAESLQELVRGRKVCVGPISGGTASLTKKLLAAMGVDSSQFTYQYASYADNHLSDSVDISISVTTPFNRRVEKMIAEGGQLWSLDDPLRMGHGSAADAFCQIYPMARTYLLPRLRDPQLNEPVLTIAVDNVLLTRAETDPTLVYSLVQTTLEHRRELGERHPLFHQIKDHINTDQLHYPPACRHHGLLQPKRAKHPRPKCRAHFHDHHDALTELWRGSSGGASATAPNTVPH